MSRNSRIQSVSHNVQGNVQMQLPVQATGIDSLALRFECEFVCLIFIARHCDVPSTTSNGDWDGFHLHLDSMFKFNVAGNGQTDGW